ncbi:heterokaryon incompatibility [Fusarium beomiforme]|uniref:Heterokaryon incompatibility n=1 Tax=Fusarium beomiforme TaxID=44412 RepID=A0A9P5A9Z0_9HYPO|nr:heterokaryon incompatibility [Fusarium beomiforme]
MLFVHSPFKPRRLERSASDHPVAVRHFGQFRLGPMESSPYQPLRSSDGQIRLLILYPAFQQRASIRCSLEPTLLSSNPAYEALSYTWGDPGNGCSISLSNHDFRVGDNAAAALRRLRWKMKKRVLWIDAICINQGDMAERNAQVNLMQKVYGQAEKVLVWLGEPTDGSLVGMRLLQNRMVGVGWHQWKIDQSYGNPTLPFSKAAKDSIALMNRSRLVEEHVNGEVRELLDRPWWRRTWIIQEAVLAKNIQIICGDECITWDTVASCLKRLKMTQVQVFGVKLSDRSMFPDQMYSLISGYHRQWHSSPGSIDLLDVLYQFRSLECTDAHDRIYGFLALILDGPDKTPRRGWARLPTGWERIPTRKNVLFRDNRTTTKQCSESSPLQGQQAVIAEHYVKQRELSPGWSKIWDNLGRAKVIYGAGETPREHKLRNERELLWKKLSKLPSWVANWECPTRWDPKPLVSFSLSQPRYFASANTTAELNIHSNPRVLSLKGHFVDEIRQLGSAWHPEAERPPISRKGITALVEWEDLGLIEVPDCPYREIGGRTNALWRTMIADYAGERAADSDDWAFIETWYDRSGWGRQLPDLASKGVRETTNLEFEINDLELVMHNHLREIRPAPDLKFREILRNPGGGFSQEKKTYGNYIRRIYDACAHRSLLVTYRGYMGLAPWNAQVGDKVAILYGGETPFILRISRVAYRSQTPNVNAGILLFLEHSAKPLLTLHVAIHRTIPRVQQPCIGSLRTLWVALARKAPTIIPQDRILFRSEVIVVETCLALKGTEQHLPVTVVAQGKSNVMEGILRVSIVRMLITLILEQRLKLLEDTVKRLRKPSLSTAEEPDKCDSPQLVIEELPENCIEVPYLLSSDDQDGVGSTGEEFYGPSSNIYYLRHILTGIDSTILASFRGADNKFSGFIKPECSPPAAVFHVEPVPVARHASKEDHYVLPPIDATKFIVRFFFRDYGSMNPFLEEATFFHTHVDPIYEGTLPPDPSKLALLDMVLAIATASSVDSIKPAMRRLLISKLFFERSKSLLSKDAFECGNLEQVQSYLLMSQYLQTTDQCSDSWSTYSMAVQKALRQGLHSEDYLAKDFNAEREAKRRTWQLCLFMDSKLYAILGQIVSTEYFQSPKPLDLSRFMDIIASITRLSQELDDWLDSLPEKWQAAILDFPAALVDKAATRNNLYMVLALALALSAARKSVNSKDITPTTKRRIAIFSRPSLDTSIESAEAIVATINAFEGGKPGPGMWWTLIQIVYNAALTCFAVICLQTKDPAFGDPQGVSKARAYIDLARQAFCKLVLFIPAHLDRCSLTDEPYANTVQQNLSPSLVDSIPDIPLSQVDADYLGPESFPFDLSMFEGLDDSLFANR